MTIFQVLFFSFFRKGKREKCEKSASIEKQILGWDSGPVCVACTDNNGNEGSSVRSCVPQLRLHIGSTRTCKASYMPSQTLKSGLKFQMVNAPARSGSGRNRVSSKLLQRSQSRPRLRLLNAHITAEDREKFTNRDRGQV